VNTDQILEENDRRYGELFCDYNPISGIGSQIERFPLKIWEDKPDILLPLQMQEKYGGIKLLQDEGDNFEDTWLEFLRDRMKYDFEFWAYWNIKIKPKGQSGGLVPFKLNWPQRYMLSVLVQLLFDDVPVRVILDKARQWGGSTLVQMFMAWIQLLHKTYWNSSIVGDVESQAVGVRTMYETAITNYRTDTAKLSFKTFQGNSDWKTIPERNCVISIGSMQRPSKIRQQDISMGHCTEVALWSQSENKTPKDLIQTLQGTILDIPYSVFVLESTAKGVGNFFHDVWVQAESGDNSYTPVFIPWFKIEMYTKKFDSKPEKKAFLESLNEYELFLWELGATLEGIKWYQQKLKASNNDKWTMHEEFPSTAEESFVFSGRPAFNPINIPNLKKDVRDPDFIGDIFPAGVEKEEAFKNINVQEVANGPLRIWAMPNDPPVPQGKIMKNRYGATVDIGGASSGANDSVISIFDRYYMSQGGLPEVVATWVGHLDPDMFAWKAAQLATFYENAYLMFESNSYDNKIKEDEGDHSYIILDKIANYYTNLYTRTSPEQIRNGVAVRWGFHTNKSTRGMLINSFREAIRESNYVEYDKRVFDQAKWFVIKDNGKMEHADGKKDDLLFTRMMGYWLVTSEESGMDPVQLIDLDREKAMLRKPLIKSAAKF
jgi:hypothetical protein